MKWVQIQSHASSCARAVVPRWTELAKHLMGDWMPGRLQAAVARLAVQAAERVDENLLAMTNTAKSLRTNFRSAPLKY